MPDTFESVLAEIDEARFVFCWISLQTSGRWNALIKKRGKYYSAFDTDPIVAMKKALTIGVNGKITLSQQELSLMADSLLEKF